MKKLYMIGNTHFDPVWLWQWDEALSSVTATFRAALERMEEYEDFKYSFSAPAVFEWIRNTDMELFERIKKRIDEGRWELCEGWWLQADCNSALGESYVRQGLYAQKYFEKHFGKKSRSVFNIDSFGHPASLVQIMAGCGIENYVFWRPNEEHKHLDAPLFYWDGENNTCVKTYRIGGDGGDIFNELNREVMEYLFEHDAGDDLMVVYGVTDHGGAPTIRSIEEIKSIAREKEGEGVVKLSSVEEFFDNADMTNAPHIKDEFQVKFIGPFSNVPEVKQNNRKSEYVLMNAERAAVIAERLIGKEYPKEKITNAWHDVMFNQFHDILGGTCIEDAYFDARNLHGRALETGKEIIHFALQGVTNKIKMPGRNPDNEWNLVIWNLNGFDIESEFEAEVQWAWEFEWYNGELVLVDENGEELYCQIIEEKPVIPKFRSRFIFRAKIPSLGYKTYSLYRRSAKALPEKTDRFEVEYDGSGITGIIDKSTGKKVFTDFLRPYVVGDICDTWGFNKTVFEDEKIPLTPVLTEICEDGCIRKTIRILWEYKKSSVEQFISLYADHIDVKYRILWNEENSSLKFALSCGRRMNCRAGSPYGSIVREASEFEKPMNEWVQLFDDDENVSVVTGSAFAYGFDGENLGITIFRNGLFGDLRTADLDETRHNRYMSRGLTTGTMRVVFGKNPTKEAIAFNNPPVILYEANHDGIFEPEKSFFKNSSEDILLTALKKAEDKDAYVIRMFNTSNASEATKIRLFENECNTILNPMEILTLTDFVKTNMLEEKI